MPELKRNIKDSVFTALFGDPENAVQLYRSLHPEDTQVSAADCKIVTLETILASGVYNDLGFQVRDRLIVLVEAQSTFSPNIVLRMLMYLATTYKEYTSEHKISLYSSRPAVIPRPELYVVYTGEKEDLPARLRLSDLYGGNGCAEVEAAVVTDGSGILGQYVAFCRISDEQRKLHGNSEQAAQEIVRICLERGILAPFLESRRKEVIDMMHMLFTQEEVDAVERYNARQEGLREGRLKGRQEGRIEGRQEGRIEGRQEGRQEGAQSRDRLYAALWEKLSALGRLSEFPKAMGNEETLRALAEEFGLEL